ncbi:hypothetical protein [Streptomyces sp. NPDC087300]|uniref:hypothetical protein n=1 Tax=Streptomyces sp. NPDC087300 TaxID=3365780 RepID=UPI0037FAE683
MSGAERPEAGLSVVRIRNRCAAMALAGCAVITLAGCSSDSDSAEATPSQDKPSSAAPSPSATPSSADPKTAAEKAVLDTYQRYWDEKATAYSKASLKGSRMKSYVKGNALGQVQADVMNLQKLGQITRNKPTLDPQIASLDLEKKVPMAKISDCLDISKWDLIDRKTEELVELPKDRRTKYVNSVTAERWGKQWVILEVQPQDRAC